MTTQTQLARQYRPELVEPQVNDRWKSARAFHAEPAKAGPGRRPPYSILIPPPNVTAALHMGHALNNTLQDILIRYHRMLGDNTMWMPGTDHAGIATQTVVEKRVLQEEGKRRTDFGRDEFVTKIQSWKDEYETTITGQLKAMGCSCDWERQRFTMDPVCARAVREAFFRLFADGLIYRGKRLVNWDPVTQTALADDEVEMQEIDGHFYYLRYPLIGPPLPDGTNFVTVATTRPETMLGDTAVAVNPEDPRALLLRGRFALLPIVNRQIPIIEDEFVVLHDSESDDAKAKYASGFLKVTPAHDPNDWEIGRRHGLAVINVLAPDGSISRDHGWPEEEWSSTAGRETNEASFLLGMDRFEAREAVVAFFKDHRMLEDITPYRHAVGHSYRSHVPIEPYLSDQWYVKVTDDRLAGAALKAMAEDQRSDSDGCNWKSGGSFDAGHGAWDTEQSNWSSKLRFRPARYARTFQAWHENIRDWCISRQLWWGHRIPVWSIKFDPAHYGGSKQRHEVQCRQDLVAYLSVCGIDSQNISIKKSGMLDQGLHGYFVCSNDPKADNALHSLAKISAHSTGATGDLLRQYKYESDALREEFGDAVLMKANSLSVAIHSCEQDPDVLDTWLSSGLWPLSTMGWPDPTVFAEQIPEGNRLLNNWNPTNVLCTAREIITLWVSRMVMFNIYLRGCLPFSEVFIHAMIQDGHGQKMSKSLGNGVDPLDIIHSHGADAMRFAVAKMTTETQDVRMPVDLICPHTGQTFEPKFITIKDQIKVAASIQECPTDKSKKMVTSYGVASGKVAPTADMPLARNTSAKFDEGRNFANKLWNAVRFALANLEVVDTVCDSTNPTANCNLELADRWILSRMARAVQAADQTLAAYEFASYGQGLYDFIWRDLCDWYIEAVKPTIQTAGAAAQRQVLAVCIDVSLRLLHPVMPFITERLWEALNEAAPQRNVEGATIPAGELLAMAAWPKVAASLVDERVEQTFGLLQDVVGAARQARTLHKVPPRQKVGCSAKAPPDVAGTLLDHQSLIETLANLDAHQIGPATEKPRAAAASLVGDVELYLHGLIDTDTETKRLNKRADDLARQVKTLRGRLSNENYLKKAPPHLVGQTRDQLAAAERESQSVKQQLLALG